MIPELNDRIDSIIRALDGVIIPALGKDSDLAREQAGLAVSHLNILKEHILVENKLALETMTTSKDLCQRLVDIAKTHGVTIDTHTYVDLQKPIEDTLDIVKIKGTTADINTFNCNLISDLLGQNSPEISRQTKEAVLVSEGAQTKKLLNYLKPFGFN